jgi:hypothetical protein
MGGGALDESAFLAYVISQFKTVFVGAQHAASLREIVLRPNFSQKWRAIRLLAEKENVR